jgi:hypothetical protein
MSSYLIGYLGYFSNNFSSSQANALLGNQAFFTFQPLVYEGKNNQIGGFYTVKPIQLEDKNIRPLGLTFTSAFGSVHPHVPENKLDSIFQSTIGIGAIGATFSLLFLGLFQRKDFSFLNLFSSEIAQVQASDLSLDFFLQPLTTHQELFGANYSESIEEIRIRKSDLPIKDNLNTSPIKLFAGLLFKAKITFRNSQDIKITFWKDKAIFITDETGFKYRYFALTVEIPDD